MKNKPLIILITGASSGIGLDTALSFLNRGAVVYGAARRVELLKPLEDKGGYGIFCDVTDAASILNCVNKIIKREGRIDILINNAGFGLGGSVEEVPLEEAKKQFDVNVFGLTEMTKAVLPYMRKQKSGRIINISSIGGKFSSPFLGWYHASKYCVEALSDSLRMELHQFGIKVSIIEPGLTRTDWGKITAKNIRKNSLIEDYSYNADKVAEYYEKYYVSTNTKISKPSVITKIIQKAAFSKHPKPRYKAGTFSSFYIYGSKFAPTWLYDFAMRILMKIK
ncbi:MAG: SDR family NAD(P)-dependent oxidoreductase [Treponema sp.]|nr:SDR family NAD(P)-dependent oxidoreductase [Candidatus Treponema merdequi]